MTSFRSRGAPGQGRSWVEGCLAAIYMDTIFFVVRDRRSGMALVERLVLVSWEELDNVLMI